MEHTDNIAPLVVDLETRITNQEARQVLDICGVQYKDYAKTLKITPNGLSSRFWLRPKEKLSLYSIDKLKDICGERNFYLALREIREKVLKETQEKELKKQGVQHKHS